MDTKFPNLTSTRPIAYVRPVQVADLPDDIQEQLEGVTQMYAIHHEEGDQLALVSNRTMAFVMARQNDFEPVSVH
ncbi:MULTISPECIES: DUF1150 family protein [Roseinatronobacter]|uniref:DUF1150 domain-containing protein n=1 Tax=Roseinatronobacter domitianus TaxID=2940293 RepID=A0ABT0M3V6_9RHOB|nr:MULTISPECIES: DUF1150 family protein [Roseibaca]MCL1629556.1 DUF1150 domain-containing protein [Roseibaca domitiana]